ncbi:MAG: glycosyltransferase family 4 protein [Panacibacter sp.]
MKKNANIENRNDHKYSIVQVIDQLNIGGTERVLITLNNLLQERGHKVSVVTTVTEGPLASLLNQDIPVINLKRKWKWNPVTMYRLIQIIKEFDIVHVHSSYNLRYLFLAATFFNLKKPIFFHEHFGDININQSVNWHTKLIYPKTIFIAVSQQIADWAIQKLGMPQKKVFVLANTVIKKEYPNQQSKNNDTKHLLIVSNFRPTKNILVGIEIFENLLKKGLPLHLTITGQVADSIYYEKVVKYIEDHQLQNAITIRKSETDIQSILHTFDLALHTAASESGPLVLIEYMAQGLPFLTYETGEVVQQIKNELPDFVMQTFDSDAWATRIMQLLQEDRVKLEQMMRVAFKKHYSSDAYYEKCILIYTKGLKITNDI